MEGRLRTIGFVVALLGISVVGYSASQSTQESEIATTTQAEALTTNENGFSGLAQVDESTYLAVHDDLVYEDGHRLTLIRLKAGMAPTSTPVTVNNWMDPDGPSSDLESLCAIPSRASQVLLAEAGYWEEEYGRLFHIELDAQDNSARVLGFSKLPLFLDNNPGQTGDQFEGLECVDTDDNSVLLILGERGGSDNYQSGRLRWGTLDLTNYDLTFTVVGEQGIDLDASGRWSDGATNRDISALHLDDEGILWAAATEDPGDLGPFYSVIYRVGTIDWDSENPIQIDETINVWSLLRNA